MALVEEEKRSEPYMGISSMPALQDMRGYVERAPADSSSDGLCAEKNFLESFFGASASRGPAIADNRLRIINS